MKSTVWPTMSPERLLQRQRPKGNHFPFRWHHHNAIEIFIPISGQGKMMVGDFIGDFCPGQVVVVGEGLPHSFYTVTPLPHSIEAQVLDISPELINKIPEMREFKALVQQADRGLLFSDSVSEHVREILNYDSPSESHQMARILDVLELLQRSKADRKLASPEYESSLDDKANHRIDVICNYIHAHYSRNIKIDEVSKRAHMTPTSLCRFFKQATGKTIVDYLHALRVSQACQQLSETRASITAIATDVGFESLSNFNRTFRQLCGMTPREYRQVHLHRLS